jgi:type IV pilus assembly protein PilF
MISFLLELARRRSTDPFSQTHPAGSGGPARNTVEANLFPSSLELARWRSFDPFSRTHPTDSDGLARNKVEANLFSFGFAIAVACLLVVGGCATEEKVKKADGYYQEGMAHLSSDRQKSFVSFQKAIQYNPRHRDAHYSIGHLYVLQGKYKQAEEEFRNAIRIDPDYSEAHNYLGDVLAEEDRWTEALEAYRRALSNPLYSTPDIAWFNMGLAYAHEGDMEKAIQAFEDARVVSPPSLSPAKLNLELGKAYYKLGYNVQAREALSRVTDLDKGGQYAMAADKLLERLKP